MPAKPMSVPAAQKALLQIAAQLQAIDHRLATVADSITPQLGRSLPGELRDGARCIRTDLLRDAIETLEALGHATESRVISRRLEIDAAEELVAVFG